MAIILKSLNPAIIPICVVVIALNTIMTASIFNPYVNPKSSKINAISGAKIYTRIAINELKQIVII